MGFVFAHLYELTLLIVRVLAHFIIKFTSQGKNNQVSRKLPSMVLEQYIQALENAPAWGGWLNTKLLWQLVLEFFVSEGTSLERGGCWEESDSWGQKPLEKLFHP